MGGERMIEVLNTTFEISIRVLLILEATTQAMTEDMLTAADFITVTLKFLILTYTAIMFLSSVNSLFVAIW